MHHFETKEEVEEVLKKLEQGFDALVRDLGRHPGQRDNRWTHVVAVEGASEAVAELAAPAPPAARAPTFAAPSSAAPAPSGPTPVERLEKLETEMAEIKEELHSLRVRLGDLD